MSKHTDSQPILPTYGKHLEVFQQEALEANNEKLAAQLAKLQELRDNLISKRNAERD